jgi:hypothetical protein
MPLTLVTGPANAGKASVVMDALRAHHARAQGPLLVVPTHADAERYRSELARAGLLPGVQVERFEGLLAEVLRRAGARERALGRLARERLLAAVLDRSHPGGRSARGAGAPGGTGPPGGTPLGSSTGVVRALAALVGELEVERVSAPRLRGALQAWAAADPAHTRRARELAGLFEGYRRALEGLRPARASPEARSARALDALRRAPALWGATPVLLYGFDDFTQLQLDAIETLGVVAGAAVTVSLAYEPGRTAFAGRGDTFQRLLPLAATHHSLRPRAEHYAPGARSALHHLERSLFEPGPSAVSAGEAVRLLEGGGERAELELLAQEIRGLLERGWRPAEIAVAHRFPESVAELLGEVFRAYGIPFALERRLRFAHTALGRALLGLLAAALAEGGEGGLGDLLAWLRGPGVLQRPELADALERRARREGASSVAQARALWEAEHWPLEPLDQLRQAAERGPATLLERTARELERLCPPLPHAARAPAGAEPSGVPAPPELTVAAERFQAPVPAELAEAHALAAGQAALEELRELARCAPELAPNARELLAILRGLEFVVGDEYTGAPPAFTGPPPAGASQASELSQPTGASTSEIPPPAGAPPPARDAVAVLDPLALRARRVRALFLCGLQEGIFPAPARPDPLLSEEERRGLAEASGLRLGRPVDALAAERYLLYAAVSRPEELLVLSWHTADDDGLPSARSLFVDDVCDLFACDLHAARTRRALGEVGEGRRSRVAPPGVTPAGLGVGVPPGEGRLEAAGEGRLEAAAQALGEGIAQLRDPLVLAQLRERRLWSASSLQAWAACPVRWFVESLLRAEDLEPEAEPLARGGLAHAALRDVLEGLRLQTGSARLVPELLARARELLHAALREHAGEFPLSTAPERVPGIRRRLEADLERYLEHAAACGEQDTPLEPTHLELSFGFQEERVAQSAPGRLGGGAVGFSTASRGGRDQGEPDLPPQSAGPLSCDQPGGLPALDLGEGILVRGRIDRVDLAPGGEAVVYDYKGRHAPPPDRWVAERSFQIPLYIRAVEELLGAHAVGGFYQPLAGRDLRARGVLAKGEGVELECVRGDAREPADLRELVGEVVAAAREAGAQARAGALEARPQTCGFGGSGCAYPSICRCER